MKLLRAFVTLAIKGSYSNAAKELFLTQPAREFDSIWSTDFFKSQ